MISPVEVVRGVNAKIDKAQEITAIGHIVQTSPLHVRFEGENRMEPTPRMSATPEPLHVGDRVVMLRVGGKWVVMSRLHGPGQPSRLWQTVEDSGYQSVVSNTSSQADLSGYTRLRLVIHGDVTSGCAGQFLYFRVNNLFTSGNNIYRWTSTQFEGTSTQRSQNESDTGFRVGLWTTTVRNNAIIDFISTDTSFWSWSAIGGRLNVGDSRSSYISSGRMIGSFPLESIQLGVAGADCGFANLRWTLEGVGS